MDALLHVVPQWIVEGLIVSAFVSIIGWSFRSIKGLFLSTNERVSLAWNRAELKRFETMRDDINARQHFLSQQILWGLTLLGVAMMFSAVASDSHSRHAFYLILLPIGAAVYMIGLHALGTMRRLVHRPERTVDQLKKRIQALERRTRS